jgi:hypothetical protein
VSVVQSSRGGWSPAAPAVHQWFNPRGGWSPAFPAAPSLRPFVSSGPLMRYGPLQCTNPFLFIFI